MRNALLFIFSITIIFLSCSKTEDQKIDKLTVIYSGNIGGRKNPCGCKPTMGGFARRSTVLNALRSQYENLLILDSGAVLYPHNFLIPPYNYVFRLDGHVSAKAFDQIGIDAVNVSSYDLSNSADSLLAIDNSTSFPWLSSNLVWRNSGELVFTPDIITKKGNIRIGIFGVMADNFMGTKLYKDDSPLEVLDPVETAQKEVSKLEKECDLIIALAQTSLKEAEEIGEKVSGIHIIIMSHNGYHNPSSDHNAFAPIKNNKTIILRCPDGGRVIGYLDLDIVNHSTDFIEVEDNPYKIQSASDNKEEKLKTGSTFTNHFINLGPEIKSDNEIQVMLDAVGETIKAYKDSLGLE